MQKNNKVLIITSSGGGGLLQAAKAKEQEVLRENPNAKIIKKNMLQEWVWKKIGNFGINMWDKAQRKGKVKVLEFLLHQQKLADFIFWPRIFSEVLRLLFKENIDRFIDTQSLGTSASIKAIRIYNRFRKKNLFLEKVIVDLPTKKASSFFETVKNLSKKDGKFLRLVTIKPLLEKGQSADDFWLKYAGLSEKEVCYEDYFVRNSFLKYRNQGKPKKQDFEIPIKIKNKEELDCIEKSCERGKIQKTQKDDSVVFTIAPNDKLFTLLLGSQPAYEATIGYVKKIIELSNKYPPKNSHFHAFIFCSHHQVGKESLLKTIHNLVMEEKNYPEHLTIIPVSFQDEEAIAPLFYRSDITCTRSGGHTSMELLEVANGLVWIHSESKVLQDKSSQNMQELLQGIPGWEAGNAHYLMDKKDAKIVTPYSFGAYFESFLAKA